MHRISRSETLQGLTLTSTVTSSPTCKSKSVSLFPLNAVATRTLCSALAIFCFARFFSFIRILRTRSLWNTKVTDFDLCVLRTTISNNSLEMVVDRTSSDRPCTGKKALSGHSDSKRKTRQKIPMSLSAQVAGERLYFLPFREKYKKNKNKQKLVPYLVTFFPNISFLNKHFILHHKKKIIVLILCDQIRNSKVSDLFPAKSNIGTPLRW